jgi:O-antigen ligase
MGISMSRGHRRWLEGVLLFGVYAIPLTVGWTVAGVHIAYGIAAAGGLALGCFCRHWPVRRSPADRAMLAFAVACLLSTARSLDPAASAVAMKKLLLLPLVHLVAGSLTTPARARWGLRCFVLGLAGTALVALLSFVATTHPADWRFRSTGHYMTFAGLLLLAWPSSAAAVLRCRGRLRLPYAAAFVVLTVALVLGFTRGAWLGAVAACVALVARHRPRRLWIVPAAAVAAFLVLPGAYRERALSSFDPAHPTNLDRVRLWHAGFDIWRDHPWTGTGWIDLAPVYRQYRRTPEGEVHGHLHNSWIHVLATLGGLGLLAFGWLMVGLGRLAWAAGRGSSDPELEGLAAGIWGAFWGFQVMGLFEWNFGDVEVTIATFFLLGAGWAVSLARGAQVPATGGSEAGRWMSS